ncbi:acetyl-coenzyme A synthetase N-terminal domain-containing protein [Streptomyces sp. NPDC056160]|uniref:acetyl-coenzyme A synthetase N-terminal domain-containing protein n=1 Tax=Streptomyces sp. NPDC056160 TaxID=3345731 RepID=UPI0035DF3335
MSDMGRPDWTPTRQDVERARITDFARFAARRAGRGVSGSYEELWKWSVDDVNGFWGTVCDYFGLPEHPAGSALANEAMPGSVWFPGSRLNFAAEVFRDRTGTDTALVTVAQDAEPLTVGWDGLRRQVASFARALTEPGVRPGDRVAGYLPDGAQAVVAFLDAVRRGASPRHVPDEIIEASGIPHTRTGKKPEVPVKRLLRGDAPDTVIDPGSVDKPELIDWCPRFGAARRARHGASPAAGTPSRPHDEGAPS